MRRIVAIAAALIFTVFSCSSPAFAAEPPLHAPTGCEGPKELCDQVLDLQAKLNEQKAVADRAAGAAATEKTALQLAAERKHRDRTMKLVAAAAVIATVLKSLISALRAWKGYFKTSKSRAQMRLITLTTGFVAFILTNIGFGIPWWQALIVASGGPGAILVHELTKLKPALQGKAELPLDEDEKAAAEAEKAEAEKA
jgi:hypothetical protein